MKMMALSVMVFLTHAHLRMTSDENAKRSIVQTKVYLLPDPASVEASVRGCVASFGEASEVLVTLADDAYSDTFRGWAARMSALGWQKRILIALSPTAASAATEAGVGCIVQYFSSSHTSVSRDAAKLHSQVSLPALTGLSKFDVLARLLQQKKMHPHMLIVFSELDALWISDPKPQLPPQPPLLGMSNYGWNSEDTEMNIGFMAFRTTPEVAAFMVDVSKAWSAELAKSVSMEPGTRLAADQGFFNSKLNEERAKTLWGVLDHDKFALDGPRRICTDVMNHIGSIVVMHFTGHSLQGKKQVLHESYDQKMSLAAIIAADKERKCRGTV